MSVRLIHGDMREQLGQLADASVDSIVTDPPYHLTSGKKDGSGVASLNEDSPAGGSRIGTGFMGMRWDGGDVAMRPETWALLLRVAKPGAHLMAFSSSRTFHRLWCAVEDAGWEIRDTVLWLHGEGFPKSSNQRGEWEGWGTALKPAFEPVVLARKPLIGTVPENLAAHGVGALNIDACRVLGEARAVTGTGGLPRRSVDEVRGPGVVSQPHELGRWPANVLHDGSDEVVAGFPAEAGAFAPVHRRRADKFRGTYGAFKGDVDEQASTFHGERGSAARFFWCPKASRRDRDDGLSDIAPRGEADREKADGIGGDNPRNRSNAEQSNPHPTVKPTALMQYLVRLVTPRGGVVLDPFMGSGSTGKAAMREGMSFVGIELDERYIEIARRRIHSDAPLFAEVAA